MLIHQTTETMGENVTKELIKAELEAVMGRLEAWAEYEERQLDNRFLDFPAKAMAMNRATNYYNLANKINVAVSNL